MALPKPGTKGTITAGTNKGQHGTVIDPQGYWIRTDTGPAWCDTARMFSFEGYVLEPVVETRRVKR